MDNSMKELQI